MENQSFSLPALARYRIWITALGMLIIGAIIIVSIVRDRIVNPQNWQISVTGEARMQYAPDTARVTLGVQVERAKDAAEALNRLNSATAKIIAALGKLGIPKEDIETRNYSLSARTENIKDVPTPAGYDASQLLVLKIKDIATTTDRVGAAVDAATKAGANRVEGVAFELSTLSELKQAARLKAIADARAKAGAIAGELGVRLGKVVGWWENFNPQPVYGGLDGKGGGGESGGGSATIPPGTQELYLEANVSYLIK